MDALAWWNSHLLDLRVTLVIVNFLIRQLRIGGPCPCQQHPDHPDPWKPSGLDDIRLFHHSCKLRWLLEIQHHLNRAICQLTIAGAAGLTAWNDSIGPVVNRLEEWVTQLADYQRESPRQLPECWQYAVRSIERDLPAYMTPEMRMLEWNSFVEVCNEYTQLPQTDQGDNPELVKMCRQVVSDAAVPNAAICTLTPTPSRRSRLWQNRQPRRNAEPKQYTKNSPWLKPTSDSLKALRDVLDLCMASHKEHPNNSLRSEEYLATIGHYRNFTEYSCYPLLPKRPGCSCEQCDPQLSKQIFDHLEGSRD